MSNESVGKLYTIGYGDRQPAEFFAMLPEECTLIDVRRRPSGRWHYGYGRDALTRRYGRRYLSWPALGNATEDPNRWIPALGITAARDCLDALLSLGEHSNSPIVLMCAERDYRYCHRRFIAEELAALVPGLEVIHL